MYVFYVSILTEMAQQCAALDEAEQLLVVRHHGVCPEGVLPQELHHLGLVEVHGRRGECNEL